MASNRANSVRRGITAWLFPIGHAAVSCRDGRAMAVAEPISGLCAATSLVAVRLLTRHYRARRGTPLRFWSATLALLYGLVEDTGT